MDFIYVELSSFNTNSLQCEKWALSTFQEEQSSRHHGSPA